MMSETSWQSDGVDFITATRFAVLGYAREDRTPLFAIHGKLRIITIWVKACRNTFR